MTCFIKKGKFVWLLLFNVLIGVAGSAWGANMSAKFPELSSATLSEGIFPNVENVRTIMPGLTKNQVYALIGPPHFHEGVFFVKEWNYILNFKTEGGNNYVTCQFQIRYDDKGKVAATYWKDPACEEFVKPDRAVPPAAPSPQASSDPAPETKPLQQEHLELSTDALFAFGSAKADFPATYEQVKRFVQKISQEFQEIDNVNVVGYTDRIGSASANQVLSEKRAAAVREILIKNGIPASQINVRGMGSAEPKVDCSTTETGAALRDCLRPNRRVELYVSGIKKKEQS